MSLRFHEIAESRHRILNPFSEAKLELLGQILRPADGATQLDLACGKGELVCTWAQRFGIRATGVDISTVFLDAARKRAEELGVGDRVAFERAEAAEYLGRRDESFDVVSCIGATWIGQGLEWTLELMKPRLRRDGHLLVGEPFWLEPPPPEAVDAAGDPRQSFVSLEQTLDRFERSGVELVEMVLADASDWDRYEASQWIAVREWLRAHPDDPDAEALAAWSARNRRSYLAFGRRYLGWGVFVLEPA